MSIFKVDTRKASKLAWLQLNKYIKPPIACESHNDANVIDAVSLNSYYAKISSDDNYLNPIAKIIDKECNDLSVNFFYPCDVYSILSRLGPTAMGPDELPHWFLRQSAHFISEEICKIFNYSIHFTLVPACLKLAIIHPIPKVKCPVTYSDWRPIAITSIVARTLDKLMVRKFLYPAITAPGVESQFNDQFAFRPSGSCEAALILLLDKTSEYLISNNYVNMISLDMSKAFDTVGHASVIDSINSIDIPKKIHNWCIDYLADRKQCTKFNDQQSSYKDINAGVIQGSGLGPILFTIVISSLKAKSNSNCIIKYADDCIILIPESNDFTIEDEINNVTSWASSRNLCINKDKSKHMLVSLKRKSSVHDSGKDVNGISRVSDMVILGVKFCHDLTFGKHIDTTIVKCNKLYYCLRMLKAYGLSTSACEDVFYATIVSRLLYCVNAWFGFSTKCDIDRLRKTFNRGRRLGYAGSDNASLDAIVADRAKNMFKAITSNEHNVLHCRLPPKKTTKYNLRAKGHGRCLPPIETPHDMRNFLLNMIYNF